jgi:hypothetical protein
LSLDDEGNFGDLREDIQVHKDYYLIPESLWEQILSWGVFTIDCDIATVLSLVDSL